MEVRGQNGTKLTKHKRLALPVGQAVFDCVRNTGVFAVESPDISETAQHTRILLDDVFSGQFFQFYQHTMDAKEGLGYANAAHYHIVFYLLCGLWNLPLYLLGWIVPVGEFAFLLWTKALAAVVWVCCGFLLKEIAKNQAVQNPQLSWTPYFLWLCPIAFFTVLAMGQYDSLCLLLILIGVYQYQKNRLIPFVLVMGAAFVFEIFALFIFIPLLLLREKRILHLLGYGAMSLWLYLPGLLLFAGNDGDAGFFNSLIAQRLFVQQLPLFLSPSLLLVLLAGIYFLCWVWKPANEQSLQQKAIYLCFVIFAILFLCVQWHPQWLILLTPFMILTTWQSRQPQKWLLLNGIFFVGYFVMTAYLYPGQIESNLFDFGIVGEVFRWTPAPDTLVRANSIYFDLVPYLSRLAPVAFSAPLIVGMIGNFPFRGMQLLDWISHTPEKSVSLRTWVYALYIIGFGIFWFAPTAFAWCKMMGIL